MKTKTRTRLDDFITNVEALGFTDTREGWDLTACFYRQAIRMGIGPTNDKERLFFGIVNEIWGDLL